MTTSSPKAVTELIACARGGDQDALGELMPLVYAELRRIAARHLRRERPGQTLQATALVHEAYLRLVKDEKLSFQNRAHFFGIAANSMRQILIERARARAAAKRGGGQAPITLEESSVPGRESPIDVLALDEALGRLAQLDPQKAKIVELRFFGGLTVEETAEVIGVSPATIKRGWSIARAWLYREIGGTHES